MELVGGMGIGALLNALKPPPQHVRFCICELSRFELGAAWIGHPPPWPTAAAALCPGPASWRPPLKSGMIAGMEHGTAENDC